MRIEIDTIINYVGNNSQLETRESSDSPKIHTFPNPSNLYFTSDITMASDEHGIIKVTNSIGEVIFTDEVYVSKGKNRYTFAESNLWPSGVYHIEYKSANHHLFDKVIKIQ